MLYTQHFEPISTEVTVGTPRPLPTNHTIYNPHKNLHYHTPFSPCQAVVKSPAVKVAGDCSYLFTHVKVGRRGLNT